MLNFTHAIVCRVPNSLQTKGKINLDAAKKQHEAYVRLLRELSLDVIEMPPDENFPDCSFVEDAAVICNGVALIAKSSNPDRMHEIDTIKTVLKKELHIPIIEIYDELATLDGSDVLFTGREFFIGLSKWTNEAGAKAVASAFPEYPCIPIKMTEDKHLKYFVTVAGPNLLCVSSTEGAKNIIKRIEREASNLYQTLTLTEENAANVLYINGTVVHRSIEEIPISYQILSEKTNIPCRSINISELGKFTTGVSSFCLLAKKSKYMRNI